MKALFTISIILGFWMTNFGQSVTFQSYMQTIQWAEGVSLNGNPLMETSPGVFDIPEVDVLSGTNVLEFESAPASSNGVSTLDAVLIRRALTEDSPLVGYEVIAADLDKSGYIGVNDVAILTFLILGQTIENEFAFIHSELDVSNLDPFDFGTDIYKFTFEGADFGSTNFTFDVAIHGDVNETAAFIPDHNEAEVRKTNTQIQIDDLSLVSGQSYDIPFTIVGVQSIEGLQFGYALDGITVEDIEMDEESINLESYLLESSARMLIFSEDPHNSISGTMRITANRDAQLSDLLSTESQYLDEVVYSDLSIGGVELVIATSSSVTDYQKDDILISPNPVTDICTITVPYDGKTPSSIIIANSQGQVVLKRKIADTTLSISKEELGAAGLYIVSWTVGDQSIYKKMIAHE